jgi:diguanylate cyclase (GGDEF)-like protein
MKFRLPFYNSKDPARALTWAYMTAFGVIATLAIASHYATSYISDKQKESVQVAYNINSQRNAVLDIDKYAQKYSVSQEKLDYDFLVQSIKKLDQMSSELAALMAGAGVRQHSVSDALFQVYFLPPFNLDQQIDQYIEKANRFTKTYEDDLEIRKEILEYINSRADGILITSLNTALDNYQTETLAKVESQSNIQHYSMMIILAVLILEAAFIFRPLAQRIRVYHKLLLKQALEDPLTGLNNRRAFIRSSEAELQQSVRQGLPFIVALADLDHFKSVNDTYGHEVGDKVLKHFSGLLKKTLRRGDVIGRIGGEEFALVLARRTNFDQGAAVLERLCKKVASSPCPYETSSGEEKELGYTVSIGFVAVVPDNKNLTIDDYLREADKALYKAKEQGRNRVVSVEISDEEIGEEEAGDEEPVPQESTVASS